MGAARRFGVEQKEKIRQIDDVSEFFVNSCSTVADKIPVAGVDAIANHTKLWADKIIEARKNPQQTITAILSTGEMLQGTIHSDHLHEEVTLVGKCVDLEAAYKQCPVSFARSLGAAVDELTWIP